MAPQLFTLGVLSSPSLLQPPKSKYGDDRHDDDDDGGDDSHDDDDDGGDDSYKVIDPFQHIDSAHP